MYQQRTRYFHITLSVVLAASVCFLLTIALFGRALAELDYRGVIGSVFFVMLLAVSSFLSFSFLPFFQNEKRWFLISALLASVFVMGVALVWQLPLPVEVMA